MPAVITFIDVKSAFDSIYQGKTIMILRACGISSRLLRAIEVTYTSSKTMTVTPAGTADQIELLAGVLQTDTTAPFLFNIVLDCALRKATDNHKELGFTVIPRRSRTRTEKILDLDFVGNIALLSDDLSTAQELLMRVKPSVEEN